MKLHPRVLIVEDDTSARVGLEQLVRSWGFVAESATDGVNALEKVTTFRPAIVITDLVMPRMDGLGLLRALHEQGADVTTLLLTLQTLGYRRVAGLCGHRKTQVRYRVLMRAIDRGVIGQRGKLLQRCIHLVG